MALARRRVTLFLVLLAVALGLVVFLFQATAAAADFDCAAVGEIPQSECEALVALYNGTGGESWPANGGWLQSNTPCSWLGVHCAQRAVQELELSYRGLVGSLPADIEQLPGLTRLDISYNQVNRLPAELGELSQLRELRLGYNQLSELPASIGSLSRLRALGLAFNEFTNLPPFIGGLESLQTLNVSANQLRSLPPEVGSLSQLALLDASENEIDELPPELGNLSRLSVLYLNENGLSSLPTEIGQLSSLTLLDLEENQLTELPPTFGQLSNLVYLWMGDNALETLPGELGTLSRLQGLYVGQNRLRHLPPEIGALSSLQGLDLSGNELSRVPRELGNLSNLRVLRLADNELSSLPSEIGKLARLEELDLSGNQLRRLPAEAPGLLGWLQRRHLPQYATTRGWPEMGGLSQMRSLNVEGNPLTGPVPAFLMEWEHLASLRFDETLWCVPAESVLVERWLDTIALVEGNGLFCGQATAALAGTVTSPDGEPLDGIAVTLYGDLGSRPMPIAVARTDADGSYRFEELWQEITYRVHFAGGSAAYIGEYFDDQSTLESATPIAVARGRTRNEVNAVLANRRQPRATFVRR